MLGLGKKREADASDESPHDEVHTPQDDIPQRPWMETALPVFACGAGLFSDGYINNVRTAENILPVLHF
jgi:hypothetical protein